MANYSFEECFDLGLWDSFVDDSQQGTIFSKSYFIKSFTNNCRYFFVKKGDEIVGGANILLSEDHKPLRNIPFMQYVNSILYKDNSHLLHHKRIGEEFKITELIINEILSIYRNHLIINTPYFKDLRPFQWYNYNTPKMGTFINIVNYTGIINLDIPFKDLLSNYRSDRRTDLKKYSNNYIIQESSDFSLLNELHKQTFKRQGIARSKNEEHLLKIITKNALKNNYGRLSICYYENVPASASFLLIDKKRSYHLFGANNPEYRQQRLYSKIITENIVFTKKLGLKEFDFVGINSPQRGNFKISFNADILPYFSSSIELNEK